MTIKDRELLLNIHNKLKEALKPPPPTFAPQTGKVEGETVYSPSTLPLPLPPLSQSKG